VSPPQAAPELPAYKTSGELGGGLDVVQLATALAEAVGERDLAEVRLKAIKALAKAATATEEEQQVAAINLRTAERKVTLLRALTRASLQATEEEYTSLTEEQQLLEKQFEVGLIPATDLRETNRQLSRTKAKMAMLREIYETR
jgi:hypothetical protein